MKRVLPGLALFLSGAVTGAGVFALVRPAAGPAPAPHALTTHGDRAPRAVRFEPSRAPSTPAPVEHPPRWEQAAPPPTEAPALESRQASRPPRPEVEQPALPSVTRDARELLAELRRTPAGPERDALMREAIVAIGRLPEEQQPRALKELDEVTAPEPVRAVGAPAMHGALEQVLNAPDASARATQVRAFLARVNQLPEAEQQHWLEELDKATARQAAEQGPR